MSDSEIILLLIGGYVLTRRDGIDWGGGWTWPIPDYESQPAVISQEYRASNHHGVDLMYRDGARFFAREGTPVLAAKAGTVWSVDHTPRGWAVVIDHGKPFATFYQHLEEVRPLVKGQAVEAGERIGVMGADPTDPARVRHLHFEVWYKGASEAHVDPAPAMRSWRRSLWTT